MKWSVWPAAVISIALTYVICLPDILSAPPLRTPQWHEAASYKPKKITVLTDETDLIYESTENSKLDMSFELPALTTIKSKSIPHSGISKEKFANSTHDKGVFSTHGDDSAVYRPQEWCHNVLNVLKSVSLKPYRKKWMNKNVHMQHKIQHHPK